MGRNLGQVWAVFFMVFPIKSYAFGSDGGATQ